MTTTVNGDTGVSAVQDGSIVAADFQASLFAASLVGNGYQKLPSGVIIQWGAATTPAGGALLVNFPIPFPNSVFQAVAQIAGGVVNNTISQSAIDNNSVTIVTLAATTGTGVAATFRWIAIGY
jgi:hypothetical protein